MFVYGGQDPVNKPMGIFWRYDPGKNEWASLPSNPVPVHHGASATVGHKFYVFGGFRLPDTGKVGMVSGEQGLGVRSRHPEMVGAAQHADRRAARWPPSRSARNLRDRRRADSQGT